MRWLASATVVCTRPLPRWLDAADATQAVALRRDRLVARQREGYDAKRQAEIDMLGEVWRMYRAFDDARHTQPR